MRTYRHVSIGLVSLLLLVPGICFLPESAGNAASGAITTIVPLRISGTVPRANAVGVSHTTTVAATFDGDVDATTILSTTFAVHGTMSGLVTGTLSYDAPRRTLTLKPARPFLAGEVVAVSATARIHSTLGAPLVPYQWQFTVGEIRPRRVVGFTDIDAGLLDVSHGSAVWGDYDNDGDLDILLTGCPGGGDIQVSLVYHNDGPSAGFTVIDARLLGVCSSSAAWGDYDDDGDLDILLAGSSTRGPVCLVYHNDGPSAGSGWTFTEINAGLRGFY